MPNKWFEVWQSVFKHPVDKSKVEISQNFVAFRISINWNPSFQTQIYLVKAPLDVNIVKQDLVNKK